MEGISHDDLNWKRFESGSESSPNILSTNRLLSGTEAIRRKLVYGSWSSEYPFDLIKKPALANSPKKFTRMVFLPFNEEDIRIAGQTGPWKGFVVYQDSNEALSKFWVKLNRDLGPIAYRNSNYWQKRFDKRNFDLNKTYTSDLRHFQSYIGFVKPPTSWE